MDIGQRGLDFLFDPRRLLGIQGRKMGGQQLGIGQHDVARPGVRFRCERDLGGTQDRRFFPWPGNGNRLPSGQGSMIGPGDCLRLVHDRRGTIHRQRMRPNRFVRDGGQREDR